MSEVQIVSLVAMIGWLVLVGAGYRSYRAGGRKSITFALIWVALFLGVALIFGAIQ